MVWEPTARALVVIVVLPVSSRAAVSRMVGPSLNVTVPVGVTVEPLGAAQLCQSITDDVRKRDPQALLAHLNPDAKPAQRGVDEVGQALLCHRFPSSVTTPSRTLKWRTSSKSPTSVSGSVVVTST